MADFCATFNDDFTTILPNGLVETCIFSIVDMRYLFEPTSSGDRNELLLGTDNPTDEAIVGIEGDMDVNIEIAGNALESSRGDLDQFPRDQRVFLTYLESV